METLERITENKVFSVSDLTRDVAEKAKATFGYHRLNNALKARPLLDALLKAGIQPFTAESVETYMKSKEKTGMWSGTKWFLARIPVILVFLSASLLLARAAVHTASAQGLGAAWNVFYCISGVITAGVGIGFLISLWAANDNIGHGTRKSLVWKEVFLESYTGDVPEFVLNKALQAASAIRAAKLSAQFSVVALNAENEHRTIVRRDPDPFLKVKGYGTDEVYYVEVWEEKSYQETYMLG